MHELIAKIQKLLAAGCKIESVRPHIFGSDAETNIVIVRIVCPDGEVHTIRAYGEESHAVREYARSIAN